MTVYVNWEQKQVVGDKGAAKIIDKTTEELYADKTEKLHFVEEGYATLDIYQMLESKGGEKTMQYIDDDWRDECTNNATEIFASAYDPIEVE